MNNKFSISEVIGTSWEIVKKNIAPFLIAFLIFAVVIVVVYFLCVGSIFFSTLTMESLKYADDPLAVYGALFAAPGFLFGMILIYLVSFFFMIGYYRLTLQAIDQTNPGVSAFKVPFKIFINAFLAMLLLSIIYTIGFFLCIIPGIYLMLRFMFTSFYIIDQGCNPIEGMQRSWERTKGIEIDLFLLYIVLVLINMLGYLLCGIGLLITYPITVVALGLLYRRGLITSYEEVQE